MFFLKIFSNFFQFIFQQLKVVWFFMFHFFRFKPLVSSVIIIALILPILLPWQNIMVSSQYIESEHSLITIFVDKNLYDNVELNKKITRYAQDVQYSYSDTKVSIIPVNKEKTSEEIYRILEKYYFEGQKIEDNIFFLTGIIIIGDVILPDLKSEAGNMPSIFPYTDFEKPVFIWDTEDKKWIENPKVNTPSAEIWHGIIPGTKSQLFKFFDKNHVMHEKLYSGSEEFNDVIRDEILYWDSTTEKTGMQKMNLQQYEKAMDLMGYRKEFKYYTNFLKFLYSDFLNEKDFEDDIPETVKSLYPDNRDIFLEKIDDVKEKISGDTLNNIPDRNVKVSIEKLLPTYAEVVKSYETDSQEFIKNTGRWDNKSADTVPEMISVMDEYVGNEIKKINDTFKNVSINNVKQLDGEKEIIVKEKINHWTSEKPVKYCEEERTHPRYNYINGYLAEPTPAPIVNGERYYDLDNPPQMIEDTKDCTLYRGEKGSHELYGNKDFYTWLDQKKGKIPDSTDESYIYLPDSLPNVSSKLVEYNKLDSIEWLEKERGDADEKVGGCYLGSEENDDICIPMEATIPVLAWDGGVERAPREYFPYGDRTLGKLEEDAEISAISCNRMSFAEERYGVVGSDNLGNPIFGCVPYYGVHKAYNTKTISSYTLHDDASLNDEKSLNEVVGRLKSKAMGVNKNSFQTVLNGRYDGIQESVDQYFPDFFRLQYKKMIHSAVLTQYELSRIAFWNSLQLLGGGAIYNRTSQLKNSMGMMVQVPVIKAQRLVMFDEKTNTSKTSESFIMPDNLNKRPLDYELPAYETMLQVLVDPEICFDEDKFRVKILKPKITAYAEDYFKMHYDLPGGVRNLLAQHISGLNYAKTWEYEVAMDLIATVVYSRGYNSCAILDEGPIMRDIHSFEYKKKTNPSDYFLKDLLTEQNVEVDPDFNKYRYLAFHNVGSTWQWEPLVKGIFKKKYSPEELDELQSVISSEFSEEVSEQLRKKLSELFDTTLAESEVIKISDIFPEDIIEERDSDANRDGLGESLKNIINKIIKEIEGEVLQKIIFDIIEESGNVILPEFSKELQEQLQERLIEELELAFNENFIERVSALIPYQIIDDIHGVDVHGNKITEQNVLDDASILAYKKLIKLETKVLNDNHYTLNNMLMNEFSDYGRLIVNDLLNGDEGDSEGEGDSEEESQALTIAEVFEIINNYEKKKIYNFFNEENKNLFNFEAAEKYKILLMDTVRKNLLNNYVRNISFNSLEDDIYNIIQDITIEVQGKYPSQSIQEMADEIPENLGEMYIETQELLPRLDSKFHTYLRVSGRTFLDGEKSARPNANSQYPAGQEANGVSWFRDDDMKKWSIDLNKGTEDRKRYITSNEYYRKFHRYKKGHPKDEDSDDYVYEVNTVKKFKKNIPDVNTYPEEVFFTDIKNQSKDAYDLKVRQQDLVFHWQNMTAQEKHEKIQQILLSKNQKLVQPLQEKNEYLSTGESKPYAYAHWRIEGDSEPAWLAENDQTSLLLGLPTSDYGSGAFSNFEKNPEKMQAIDKNGEEQDEECGDMEGVPLEDWLDAIDCWMEKMGKLDELETTSACNLSLEEFKALQSDEKDTKNAVEKIEFTPTIEPFFAKGESKILLSFKTKEDKLAFGHDIRFTVTLENAKMRDVINDVDLEKEGTQLINRTGEEWIEIIPDDNVENVKITVKIDDENLEKSENIIGNKEFEVLPQNLDVFYIEEIQNTEVLGVKGYEFKITSPVDFIHFDEEIVLSISPEKEGILGTNTVELNTSFKVGVRTDESVILTASLRGSKSVSKILSGVSDISSTVGDIQLPTLPNIIDLHSRIEFDVRYLNELGTILDSEIDGELQLIKIPDEERKKYNVEILDNQKIQIETKGVIGEVTFTLQYKKNGEVLSKEFSVWIGGKHSVEEYEKFNFNALYATIVGLENYGTNLNNHFATKILHSSDNLNVVTTQIIAPKVKKPVARIFNNGTIETYSSGYKANLLNISPLKIGLYDKKEKRYKGKFDFVIEKFEEENLYLQAPVNEEKGIFFEKLSTAKSISAEKKNKNIFVKLDNIDILSINNLGNIEILDNNFRVEIDEKEKVLGISLLIRKNDTSTTYGRITLRGGKLKKSSESIWVKSLKDEDGYEILETDAKLVPLFSTYQTNFSKNIFSSGFKDDEKYVLEYASGLTVGEATQSSADLFLVNLGDPSISIPPPADSTSSDFDRTIGKSVLKEKGGTIQKILPFDFDGDGKVDIAEISSEGFVHILLNTGNANGDMKQWGKAVRIDSDYRSISKLSIKEDAEDVYDDLVYVDRFGKFHHIKNKEGVLSIVDNPEYFPKEILITSEIEDLNKDGFSDIIGITENNEIKIWYGNSNYFISDPVNIDSYGFVIPKAKVLAKSVLINFKNIESISDFVDDIKQISYISKIKSVQNKENKSVEDNLSESRVLKEYEDRAVSEIILGDINSAFSAGVSEKPFVEAQKIRKSLSVTKIMIEDENTNKTVHHTVGKKYITQIEITSKDTKDITFNIADLYGNLMEIDQFSVVCKYKDASTNTCGEEYAGFTFPNISRAVIFENIVLKPNQTVVLSYYSFIKKLPKLGLSLANLNNADDNIIDFIVKNPSDKWAFQYESVGEKLYSKKLPDPQDLNVDLEPSHGIDVSLLSGLLDPVEISDADIDKIINTVEKINTVGNGVNVSMGMQNAMAGAAGIDVLTPKEQLEEYIKSLFPKETDTTTRAVGEIVENFVEDLLDWQKNGKFDDDGNSIEFNVENINTDLQSVMMGARFEAVKSASGIEKAVDNLTNDDDGDGVPNQWDEDLDKAMTELETVLDDSIDFLASCNGGGCLDMPVNFAFLVPGEMNISGMVNQVYTSIAGQIGNVLKDDTVSLAVNGAKQMAMDGVGNFEGDQPFVMTIFNFGSGTFCVLYACFSYYPIVSIPFETGFSNSEFRFYLSPTVTGGLGFVICTGSGNSTSDPGGSCFIQAIEGDLGDVCNDLAAKINNAIHSSLGAGSRVFEIDSQYVDDLYAEVGGSGDGTMTIGAYSLGNIDTSIPSSQNTRINSENYFGRWLNRQIEEITSMFTVPTLTILYPDISNTFFGENNTSITAGMIQEDDYKDASNAFSNDTSNITFENQWNNQEDKEKKQDEDRSEGVLDSSESGINSVYDYITPQGKNKEAVKYSAKSIDDFYRILESVPIINIRRESIVIKYPSLSRKELLTKIHDLDVFIEAAKEELNTFEDLVVNWPADRKAEHQQIVRKCKRFIKDLVKLLDALNFYKDEAGDLIADFDSQMSRYIYSIVCYLNAITDLTGGWLMKNKIRYEKWLEFYDTIIELMKMYKKIPEILNGYQASCEQCRATNADSSDNMVGSIGSFFPEPPIIRFPRLPDLVLDVSQINAGITVSIPEITFKAVPLKIPNLPKVLLPNVPILAVNLKFPKVPNLPIFELPVLPEFPDLNIPVLPNIPPPPKLPDIPSELMDVMEVIEKALYLYCIIVRQGIFFHDEDTAMSVVETLTNRKINPLSMDFISKDFPDIVLPSISEIEIIAEVNLEKDLGAISDKVQDFADGINDATTNMVKDANRNLSDNYDKYGDPIDLSDNKYVKKVEREVENLQENINKEIDDKYNKNVDNLNDDVNEGMNNINKHIENQENRNQENVNTEIDRVIDKVKKDLSFENLNNSEKLFKKIIAKDMQNMQKNIKNINNPKNYISVSQLRKKMGLHSMKNIDISKKITSVSPVLSKYQDMNKALISIQKYYEKQETFLAEKNIHFLDMVAQNISDFPKSKVYACEGENCSDNQISPISEEDKRNPTKNNSPQKQPDEGIFIQSETGAVTKLTEYTDEVTQIHTFFKNDMDGDGLEDIVYATSNEIFIKYANNFNKNYRLKYLKQGVYVPENGDPTSVEILNFEEILPEFLSPKNLEVFGDGKKLSVSVLPEPKELISGVLYTIDDSITFEQRKGGDVQKIRKYIFQLTKETFDKMSQKYSGMIERDVEWEKEVGENFIEINNQKIFLEPNSIVRIDKFDYGQLETFIPINDVKSLKARWITKDGKLSNYANHDLLFNTQASDTHAPLLLSRDIYEEKLMYKKNTVSLTGVFDLENGDSSVSWDTDNDGIYETTGDSFTTKIHEELFEKENVPFKVTDTLGNEAMGTAYITFISPYVKVDSATENTVKGHVEPRYANVPVVLLRERFGVLKKIRDVVKTNALGEYIFEHLDNSATNLAILKDESGIIIGEVGKDGQLHSLENAQNYEIKLLEGDKYLPLRQVLVNSVTGKVVATLVLKSNSEYSVKLLQNLQSFTDEVDNNNNKNNISEYNNSVFITDNNETDDFVFGQMPLDASDNAGGGVIFSKIENKPMVMVYPDGNIRFFPEYKDNLSVRQKNIIYTNSDDEEITKIVVEILNSESKIFEVLLDIQKTKVNIDFDTVASASVLDYENNNKQNAEKYSFINIHNFTASVDNLIPNSKNTSSELFKKFPFTDLSEQKNKNIYNAVKNLYEKNMISGYENNKFKPNQKITRAEFVHEALAVTKCLDCINPSDFEKNKYYKPFSFSDIVPQSWYDFCISKAKEISMIKGYKNGEFRPNQNITRAESVAILLRQADIPLEQTLNTAIAKTESIGDLDPSQWFYKEMITGINLGLIDPVLGFSFPNKQITRGEFAIMSDKIFVLRDCRDVDSDNDGIFDYLEEYYGSNAFDKNSIPENIETLKNPRDELLSPIPENQNNQIIDDLTDKENSNNFDKNIENIDSDADGIPDYKDIDFSEFKEDINNNNISDRFEEVLGYGTLDINNNGILDYYDYSLVNQLDTNTNLSLTDKTSTNLSLTDKTKTNLSLTDKTSTNLSLTDKTSTRAILDYYDLVLNFLNNKNNKNNNFTLSLTDKNNNNIIDQREDLYNKETSKDSDSKDSKNRDDRDNNKEIYPNIDKIPHSFPEVLTDLCPLVPEDYDRIDDADGCPELEKAEDVFEMDISTLFVNNTDECSFVDYADEFRNGDMIKTVILSPNEKYLYKESDTIKISKSIEY